MNENVLESDFVPLCDGTTRHRSLANIRLHEEHRIRGSWPGGERPGGERNWPGGERTYIV